MVLTKEQKLARKEAKKEAKQIALVEAGKQIKRDELKREITMQAKKRGELDNAWRLTMMQIKEPVFRNKIMVMHHSFERAFDKKDFYMNHLLKLKNVANDQIHRSFSFFCDTVDIMINKFLSNLEEMAAQNQRKVKEYFKTNEDNTAVIVKDHEAAEKHMHLMLFHTKNISDLLAWTTRGEDVVREEDERLRYGGFREDLRSYLENSFNVTWEKYKEVLKTYIENTIDLQKKARKLRRKEITISGIIATQAKKIADNDGVLVRLRNELLTYESGNKQNVFRERRNRHRIACSKLKQHLIQGRASDEIQLDILVHESDSATEWLENGRKRAEKILRLAALCRRHETRCEKVLPFGTGIPYLQTNSILDLHRMTSCEDFLNANTLSTSCGLTKLWHRISKADVTRRALLQEKKILEKENEALMAEIECNDCEKKPKPQACMCNLSDKSLTTSITKPVAIDGALALAKYRKFK